MSVPAAAGSVLSRFVAACLADDRVVAAFLGGSHASGSADAYSDLDLYLITTDEVYQEFVADRAEFVRLLGEPLFLEDFDLPDVLFFILADGTEGELGLGRTGDFGHIHLGPYRALVDKKNLLAGVVFVEAKPAEIERRETLRRFLHWFWHDLSHFITAMGRSQLWWAYGQLETLRRCCINLARLAQDPLDIEVGEEGFFKVDLALPGEQLAPLRATFCPLEPVAMLHAALAIVDFYRALAPDLARAHGLAYPIDLERILVNRLVRLHERQVPS